MTVFFNYIPNVTQGVSLLNFLFSVIKNMPSADKFNTSIGFILNTIIFVTGVLWDGNGVIPGSLDVVLKLKQMVSTYTWLLA